MPSFVGDGFLEVVIMVCTIKTRLVTEYEAETKKFAAALTELQQKVGTSTKDEYVRLQLLVDEARVKSEQSRLALERHVTEHKY